MDLDNLVDIYIYAENKGYVLLPDDYTALGYAAMAVNDYNRVLFIVTQINLAIKYTDPKIVSKQMAKYEDGTYGIR